MDQPIVGNAVETLADGERGTQPCGDKVAVDDCRGVPAQDARCDQRVRIEGGDPEAAVARVDELDQSAGWQRLGAGVHLDLVREHPRMALAGALVASGLQANLRQRGDAFGQGGHRRHSKALSGENEPL